MKKKNISPNFITVLDSGNHINMKSTELGQFEAHLKHGWLSSIPNLVMKSFPEDRVSGSLALETHPWGEQGLVGVSSAQCSSGAPWA